MPHRPQPRTAPPPSLRLSQHSPPSFRSPRKGGWLFVRTCGQFPYCRSFCTSRHAPRRHPTYFTDTQILNLHHLHLLPKHKQTFSCPALPLIVAHAHGQRCTRPWTTLHTPMDNVAHGRGQRRRCVPDKDSRHLKMAKGRKQSQSAVHLMRAYGRLASLRNEYETGWRMRGVTRRACMTGADGRTGPSEVSVMPAF